MAGSRDEFVNARSLPLLALPLPAKAWEGVFGGPEVDEILVEPDLEDAAHRVAVAGSTDHATRLDPPRPKLARRSRDDLVGDPPAGVAAVVLVCRIDGPSQPALNEVHAITAAVGTDPATGEGHRCARFLPGHGGHASMNASPPDAAILRDLYTER